jgi:hypothetical protein
MEVVEQLECECNGRVYPTKSALNAHRRTKMHQTWETEREVFELKCRCKRLENENEALRYDLQMYRRCLARLNTDYFSPLNLDVNSTSFVPL